MNDHEFLVFLRSQGHEPVEISLDNFLKELDESMTFMIAYEHTFIPTVFFSNLPLLSKIGFERWWKIINNSSELSDKYMMGLINIVDVFYRYIMLDLRPLFGNHFIIEEAKASQVLEYYDIPMLLWIPPGERKNLITI